MLCLKNILLYLSINFVVWAEDLRVWKGRKRRQRWFSKYAFIWIGSRIWILIKISTAQYFNWLLCGLCKKQDISCASTAKRLIYCSISWWWKATIKRAQKKNLSIVRYYLENIFLLLSNKALWINKWFWSPSKKFILESCNGEGKVH